MQSTTVFPDILKIADFRWKNAVSRTQGVGHVIYVFFRSSLGKVHLCFLKGSFKKIINNHRDAARGFDSKKLRWPTFQLHATEIVYKQGGLSR